MRHCANRAGLAVGLIAAAAIGLIVIVTGAPASAQDDPVAPINPLPVTPVCGGSGDIDDGGAPCSDPASATPPAAGRASRSRRPRSGPGTGATSGEHGRRARPSAPSAPKVNSCPRTFSPEGSTRPPPTPGTPSSAPTLVPTARPRGLLVIETSPPIDPLVLRDRVRDRIDPAAPVPMTAPMWGEIPAVVHLPTWLWVDGDWEPIEESESQGLVTVVVQARPVQVARALGEHGGVICDGPGTEWSPGTWPWAPHGPAFSPT